LFIAATALVATVWWSGFSPATIADPEFARKVPNRDLRNALAWSARNLDAIWIFLGAATTYLALVRAEGLKVARKWSALVLLAAVVLCAASAWTGWPLGPVVFPENLGIKLGPIPFALPFLWLVLIVGARETAQRIFSKISHGFAACLAGAICALSSVNLDPIAWKYRAWWLWYPARLDAPTHPPLITFATWGFAGTLLAYLMRSPHVAPRMKVRPLEPILVFGALNLVVALTHCFL
jgi:uncharacterized membrane protein